MFAYFLWRCRVPDFGGRCDPGYVRTALAEDRRQCPKRLRVFARGFRLSLAEGDPFRYFGFLTSITRQISYVRRVPPTPRASAPLSLKDDLDFDLGPSLKYHAFG